MRSARAARRRSSTSGVRQRRRLEDLEAAALRQRFNRARRAVHAAARRPVRLRQNQRDLMPGVREPRERALGECRGPRED